jgi:hypothetical protein
VKLPFVLILLWPFGAWLIYLAFRSLKRVSIQYRSVVYERGVHPFWFWFYTILAGVGGSLLIGAVYVLFAN